jgi:tetratricopeptide (TPR) repeat protein
MGDTLVKLRSGLAFLMIAAVVAAGCGSDDDTKEKKSSAKPTAAETVLASKKEAVSKAEKAFDKDGNDVDACRNLAMSYVALASPESTGDPKKAPEPPKDREKNLKKSTATLEKCTKIAPKDRNVQQMLASTLMAQGQYEDASPLLESLAKSAKQPEAANAFYAWGLAASNAMDTDDAITAWRRFIALSPKDDTRIAQVRGAIKSLEASRRAAAKEKAAPTADSDAAEGAADAEGDDAEAAAGDDN